MSYKTLLVHVDHSRHAPQRIRIAAEIALRENAHLTGIAMTGVSRYLLDSMRVPNEGAVLKTHIGFLKHQAEKALDGRGRVLLRPSGTEPLLRVMVEGEPRDAIEAAAASIADAVRTAASG